MAEPAPKDLFTGLAGLELSRDFELGCGVVLSRTYAHLFAPFMAAFTPAPPGGHHPAPWKAATGGFSFDITAQLRMPGEASETTGDNLLAARTILFCFDSASALLLRCPCCPRTRLRR